MHRPLLSTGTPQTRFHQDGSERWYVLQNWRQDVAVIIDEAAQPPRTKRERVFYSPYGRVFGMVAGDTGFDGHYGTGDSTALSGWTANSHPYRAYADVDLDGDVDTTDAGYTTNASMGWDALSRDGSTIGYAGYVQDDFIPTVNHVRHRAMKTDLGRWVQRDPAGYVDGANLYEYVRSSPVGMRDPMGLASRPGFGTGSGCGLGGSVGFDSCGGGGATSVQQGIPLEYCNECCQDQFAWDVAQGNLGADCAPFYLPECRRGCLTGTNCGWAGYQAFLKMTRDKPCTLWPPTIDWGDRQIGFPADHTKPPDCALPCIAALYSPRGDQCYLCCLYGCDGIGSQEFDQCMGWCDEWPTYAPPEVIRPIFLSTSR